MGEGSLHSISLLKETWRTFFTHKCLGIFVALGTLRASPEVGIEVLLVGFYHYCINCQKMFCIVCCGRGMFLVQLSWTSCLDNDRSLASLTLPFATPGRFRTILKAGSPLLSGLWICTLGSYGCVVHIQRIRIFAGVYLFLSGFLEYTNNARNMSSMSLWGFHLGQRSYSYFDCSLCHPIALL